MKKTYISPKILLVELRCKVNMLEGSLQLDNTRSISTQNDGSWTKEYNSTSNTSVWDNEW